MGISQLKRKEVSCYKPSDLWSQEDDLLFLKWVTNKRETVLGFFGFDRTVYSNIKKKNGRREWYDELREERTNDIQTEMLE
jgi:hypothetical protein